MTSKMIGHNQPPLTIEDFYILDISGKSAGRIKITNTIIKKYLTRKTKIVKRNGENVSIYVERIINDSEKIGLRVKINTGGTKTFFYRHWGKGKTDDGKRRNYIPYHLGNFPEMKIEAARSLVENLKQAIKLGKDPRSVIEERKKAKKLSEVIAQWLLAMPDHLLTLAQLNCLIGGNIQILRWRSRNDWRDCVRLGI